MSALRRSYTESPVFGCPRVPGLPKFSTRAMQKREEEMNPLKRYVIPNETGDLLHTASYINDKGDTVWLKFDVTRPCTKFETTETRFYKPKLHTIRPDPYNERPGSSSGRGL